MPALQTPNRPRHFDTEITQLMTNQVTQNSPEVQAIFSNSDPDVVWENAAQILQQTAPGYDMRPIRPVFDDVMAMFAGEHLGYAKIMTP